jgi:D-alanyl-D-alanine carboxypeptidase
VSALDGRRRNIFSLWLCAFVLTTTSTLAGPVAAKPSADKYASIVIDAGTGQVLHEVNADRARYPASLTKMMTLYLVFEAIDAKKLSFDSRLPVSQYASERDPTRLDLKPGEMVAVRDLVLGLITKSANDAAAVLAEGLAGSEGAFAERMTRKAAALGMKDTVFRNASGLPDPEQVSTARDLARLSQALYQDFPHHYWMFATQDFTFRGRHYLNHNRLLKSFAGMDGLKTGFIRASGFNLAASAKRGDRRLIGVVMGGETGPARDKHMASLLENAFGGGMLVAEKKAPSLGRAVARLSPIGTAEASPTVKKTAANDDEAWAIQVGAYSKQVQATKAAQGAVGKVSQTQGKDVLVLAPYKSDKKKVFRARLTGFSEDEARDACRALQAKKTTCAVIAP